MTVRCILDIINRNGWYFYRHVEQTSSHPIARYYQKNHVNHLILIPGRYLDRLSDDTVNRILSEAGVAR